MSTWHIHITGQVQGVGFRPYVYQLALQHQLQGWVNNGMDGVHIFFNASVKKSNTFYKALLEQPPPLARITAHQLEKVATQEFQDFKIIHSDHHGAPNLLLSPDFSYCADCKEDFEQSKNRRRGYWFTTCTNCGPRYSIIHQLPYDREGTSMDQFSMCSDCLEEYHNPEDRRYYSQTNSCPNCAIALHLVDRNGKTVSRTEEEILNLIPKYWEAGKIVALKGIGGYLLSCDARNEAPIATLRQRKHRPSKPFALMYPDLNTLKQDVELRERESKALQSLVAPITLLSTKQKDLAAAIAPKLSKVGAMLPYTPMYALLLKQFGRPIIATSGNISNAPIVYEDKLAMEELSDIADYVLVHNRSIAIPQDDSVLQFSPFKQQRIVLRRSRGIAPTYINSALQFGAATVFAAGAMLKSTFSLLYQGNTYISQYIGDLEHFASQQNYQRTCTHFFELFKAQPTCVLVDQHPDYPSTQYGKALASKWNIPVHTIQHHISHFGAVLGEHNLIDSEDPVLGVIWDGTGLGLDQHIWGGEFFRYEQHTFSRYKHFEYFDYILGDKMPREPRVSALSCCWGISGMDTILKEKFTATEWQVYCKLLKKQPKLQTSSVGRLFDAVAAILGILDKQTYEGEAAMQLEDRALQYCKQNGLVFKESYFDSTQSYENIPTKTLMQGILTDIQNGRPIDFIAAKFHYSLADLIRIIALQADIQKLAFSGGVFQNALLVDLIIHHLGDPFELYFHKELSPNDENISFGQLVCHYIDEHQKHFIHQQVASEG